MFVFDWEQLQVSAALLNLKTINLKNVTPTDLTCCSWQTHFYLQSCIQSLRHIEFLELLVVFGQMLLNWLTNEIIILEKRQKNHKINLMKNKINEINRKQS